MRIKITLKSAKIQEVLTGKFHVSSGKHVIPNHKQKLQKSLHSGKKNDVAIKQERTLLVNLPPV